MIVLLNRSKQLTSLHLYRCNTIIKNGKNATAPAIDLDDLKIPPTNRLERLSGDRKKQYSIRVNKQFRICFVWENGFAEDVELVDCH